MPTKQRHEKRRLARTRGTDDKVNLPALEDNFVLDPEGEVAAIRARGQRPVVLVGPSERSVADADDVALGRAWRDDGLDGRGVLLVELVQKLRLTCTAVVSTRTL